LIRPSEVTILDEVNTTLSKNVRRLRATRDFTYDDLAALAGLSKGMLVQIEQGRTNPSIGTLCKLANALGVTISRLIEEPTQLAMKKTVLSQLPNLWGGPEGSTAKLLAGVDGANLVELWDWKLLPGHHHTASAHPVGTKEVVYVLKGSLVIEIGTSSIAAKAQEAVLIRSDQDHQYRNDARSSTHFAMVVIEPSLS
jgi:transcriptional regulator with XRE-family HTH domain